LEAQNPWSTPQRTENLLALIPDKLLADALRKKWDSAPGRSSVNKWADIDALAKAGVSRNLDGKALLEAKKDIVLEYTYPRLDVEVSKKLIHLLKSPFVVHPKTGRVCVPIPVTEGSWGSLERFDPLAVPTVTDLLAQIDSWSGRSGGGGAENGKSGNGAEEAKVQDYEKTDLKPYVDYFKEHVAALLKTERGVKREREDDNTTAAAAAGESMEF
jgi:DNA primase small subunit